MGDHIGHPSWCGPHRIKPLFQQIWIYSAGLSGDKSLDLIGYAAKILGTKHNLTTL